MFNRARHVPCRRVVQYFCLLTIFAVCLNISQYRSGPGQAAWLGWVCSVWPGSARARGSVNFANMAWPVATPSSRGQQLWHQGRYTLRLVNALRMYVCKCASPIGWRAHQADNRGHWLVCMFADLKMATNTSTKLSTPALVCISL